MCYSITCLLHLYFICIIFLFYLLIDKVSISLLNIRRKEMLNKGIIYTVLGANFLLFRNRDGRDRDRYKISLSKVI